MPPLRVLITNLQLLGPTGTEMYVYDLARWLSRTGHTPVIYSPQLGPLAERLIEQSIPVVDRLENIAVPPDVVHGHHSLETMAAMLQFPQTPGIFICHDCSAWHDHPPRLRRLRRYVAVDQACRDRLTLRDGIPPDRVCILQNGVDAGRFRPRAPLPPRPRRALLISNNADNRTLGIVRQACQQAGLQVDFAGLQIGGRWDHPEERLTQYDLVFAKGRCAWEAMTVGNAVIVCDAAAAGPLVTTDHLKQLAACNFGRRLLTQPLTVSYLLSQIARYDAHDATEASRQIRQRADLNIIAAQLVETYQQVIDEHLAEETSQGDESRSVAEFLQWWSAQREQLVRQQAARLQRTPMLKRLWRSLRKRVGLFRAA